MKSKKWVWILGCFVLLVGAFAACGDPETDVAGNNTETTEADVPDQSAGIEDLETGDDVGGDTGTLVEEEEKEAPEKFVKVFKGTAQMTGNSKKFTIEHGNEVKISWKGNGGEMSLFSVIMKTADGGHTPVTVMGEMGETKGSQTFYNIQPGEYYLQWNTANFKPTVTVEEK